MQHDDPVPPVDLPDPDELQAAFEEAMPDYTRDTRQLRNRRTTKAKRKKVSNARSALLAVAILSGIATLLYAVMGRIDQSLELLIAAFIYFLLTVGFIGLYAWARRQPYPALLTGLLVYVGLWCLDIVLALLTDPTTIFGGAVIRILIRILVVAFLLRGVLAARRLHKPTE